MLRIIVILLVLASCNAAPKQTQDSEVYYTCSMDPQVVERAPGKCPICKMELTPVKKNSSDQGNEIALSEQQVMLGNIRVDSIRMGGLAQRMVLTGTLNFDQMKTTAVSARVMGRIERLMVKNPGDPVQKGMPLYEIYSEELNNAKQEYLLALDRKKTFGEGSVVPVDELVQGARNKLLLWGMQDQQIRAMETSGKAGQLTTFLSPASGYVTQLDIREGDYIMEGGSIVRLADLSTLWAEAQVYTTQLEDLNRAGTARVELPDLDGKSINGKIEFVNPEINPDTRINLIRVSIPNPGLLLKPGMPAYVILHSAGKKALSLPLDAVIRDANGATAWIQTRPLHYQPVKVQTGRELDDQIEILEGLNTGDVVVVSGAYLLHSEYVFRKGAQPLATHAH